MSPREELESLIEEAWNRARRDADLQRDPRLTTQAVRGIYAQLEPDERGLANEILCQWLLGEDPRKLYDAIVLVKEFQIKDALGPLRELMHQAEARPDHEAPFDWAWFNRTIASLEGNDQLPG